MTSGGPCLRIGTRGSALALWQAHYIARRLQETAVDEELRVEFEIIKTSGDRIVDRPLAQVGGKGLFVKEIEEALLVGRIDLAVHSMKDVPASLPPGLVMAALTKREDPRDVLISAGEKVDNLPRGARVGTSSVRRSVQVRARRPDLTIVDIRGNIDTRLRKLEDGEYAAIILAAAGMHRLGYRDRICEYLGSPWISAIGQGVLGIETRSSDHGVIARAQRLHHAETARCLAAERSLMICLGGGCHVPLGALAQLNQAGALVIEAFVAHPSGAPVFRANHQGSADLGEQLGAEVAQKLLSQGAGPVLAEIAAD